MIKITIAAFLICLSFGCTGSNDRDPRVIVKPRQVKVSAALYDVVGRNTHLGYVADQRTGYIGVFAADDARFLDVSSDDEFDKTGLVAGQQPMAMILVETTGLNVLAVDRQSKTFFGYSLASDQSQNLKQVSHQPFSLGGTNQALTSNAIFADAGRFSNPDVKNIVVDTAAVTQSWELTYSEKDGNYTVEGSVSGVQAARAVENATYTSDDGSFSCFVQSGGEPTTSGDRFLIGVEALNVHVLPSAPLDMLLWQNRVFVFMENPASVWVFDLDSLSIVGTFPIGAGSARLGRALQDGGMAYVTDTASNTFYSVDLAASVPTISASTVLEPMREVCPADAPGTFWALPVTGRDVQRFDVGTQTITDSVSMTDQPKFMVPYQQAGNTLLLVPGFNGGIDVLDQSRRLRVDTDVRAGERQSRSIAFDFFDTGAESEPQLVSASTEDYVTRNERWQVEYEGALSPFDLNGVISATALNVPGALFENWKVAAGDAVDLSSGGSSETVFVASVTDQENLVLASTPSLQGSVSLSVRANSTYTVRGSVSGLQSGRLSEGTVYDSDNGEVSILIRASISLPTTRGDLFTFFTQDGIDPIDLGSLRLPSDLAIFTHRDGRDRAIVAIEASGVLADVNLSDLTLSRVFD